ncbi:S8 family serine peptidase [Micromonospora sp. KC213]|uniref:S8 family serine peptidase n=1 Tax=Micromonospora sp. KC213 TaxID=2530378 RepID=UPI001050A0CF|nr:S8 family serine peptidase [Micromonospora sp. KC213]TDC41775.1 type VII secretion-associated serine protease [Micromonospora sp. KC213]
MTIYTALAADPLTSSLAIPSSDSSNRIRKDQWHLQFLRITEAHKVSYGEGVVVAVPDTGVAPHPDLTANLLPGIDIIPGGSGDGRQDTNSHGTCMAGIVAAHGRNNEVGALGIAPRSKILPIYDTPRDGLGSPADLARSIEYSVRKGAGVISISAASSATVEMQHAIKSAVAANVTVVAAAGNLPRESGVTYPASEDAVIAVGGIDREGNRASISVTGPEIDVVAPAVDIYCTGLNGRYRVSTGTSDATAIVAGAAALIRSKYPHLPAAEVAHRLTATAVDKGPPGRDDEYGHGVLDIVAALTADVPPLGFESSAVTPPATSSPAARAPDAGGDSTTARGLVTLGVLVAAGGGYWVWRRRRHADDPPPRISR